MSSDSKGKKKGKRKNIRTAMIGGNGTKKPKKRKTKA